MLRQHLRLESGSGEERPPRRAFAARRLPEVADIRKRVHPHGLRHTHAAELRQEGFDIGIIRKHLGHRDISTTARYLDHVAPWAVVEAVAARWVESPRLAESVAGFPNLR